MPLFAPEPAYINKQEKKLALNQLESYALAWTRDHGEHWSNLRDLCHEIETTIDKERQNL